MSARLDRTIRALNRGRAQRLATTRPSFGVAASLSGTSEMGLCRISGAEIPRCPIATGFGLEPTSSRRRAAALGCPSRALVRVLLHLPLRTSREGDSLRPGWVMDNVLEDGARVGIIGGGPAGSLCAYFLLTFAARLDLDLHVDLYEPRDFGKPGPAGCNMCGGIVSESLVQAFALEGINLPPTVVQRGIDSYVLHTEEQDVKIDTPLEEKRIAALHRGGGPRDVREKKWGGLDAFLLALAQQRGATHVPARVSEVGWDGGRPQIRVGGTPETYDLVVGAAGVNSSGWQLFEQLGLRGSRQPETTKAYVTELPIRDEAVLERLGCSMHMFLLNIPRLDCAAIIPKGEYATICLLGRKIDRELIEAFFASFAVRRCFPAGWSIGEGACHCAPKINIREASVPFTDRVVLVGDCGVTRLYKDGIGAAYRTAKAAARTAVFSGVGASDFRTHYWPVYRTIAADNLFGELIFTIVHQIRGLRPLLWGGDRDGGGGTEGSRQHPAHEHCPVGHVHRKRALSRDLPPHA